MNKFKYLVSYKETENSINRVGYKETEEGDVFNIKGELVKNPYFVKIVSKIHTSDEIENINEN